MGEGEEKIIFKKKRWRQWYWEKNWKGATLNTRFAWKYFVLLIVRNVGMDTCWKCGHLSRFFNKKWHSIKQIYASAHPEVMPHEKSFPLLYRKNQKILAFLGSLETNLCSPPPEKIYHPPPPQIWPKKWGNSWHCKKCSFSSIFHLFWSNFQCLHFYKFELTIWGDIWNIWNVFLAAETTFLEIFCQKMCKKSHKFPQKSGGGGGDTPPPPKKKDVTRVFWIKKSCTPWGGGTLVYHSPCI